MTCVHAGQPCVTIAPAFKPKAGPEAATGHWPAGHDQARRVQQHSEKPHPSAMSAEAQPLGTALARLQHLQQQRRHHLDGDRAVGGYHERARHAPPAARQQRQHSAQQLLHLRATVARLVLECRRQQPCGILLSAQQPLA